MSANNSLVPIVVESSGRGERATTSTRASERPNCLCGRRRWRPNGQPHRGPALFLANEDPEADIHLYVNSPGGSVTAGLGIIDTMKFVPNDVCTYIIGQAASMGSLIACSGTKGKRFTLQHSRNLMHQPLLMGVMEGQATDLEIEAREMLRMREALYGIYSEASGKTTEEIAATCERNTWLDAGEMLEYGIVDRVLDSMPIPGADA